MADKEERILIARSIDYTLTDTDKGELFEGKIAPHCANVFTRQDAIERMAKSICRTYGEDCETCRFNGNEKGCKRYLEFQNYIAMAEAALNELLDGHDDER